MGDPRPASADGTDSFLSHINDAENAGGEEPGAFKPTPEDILALLLFWATGIIVFLQFFTRYVLGNSFSWTEEIARYLLVGLTFIGAAGVAMRGEHIGLTYFRDLLPARARHVVEIAVGLLAVALLAGLAWYGGNVASLMGGQPMTSIDYSMGIVYWAVTGGLAATALRAALVVVRQIRRRRA